MRKRNNGRSSSLSPQRQRPRLTLTRLNTGAPRRQRLNTLPRTKVRGGKKKSVSPVVEELPSIPSYSSKLPSIDLTGASCSSSSSSSSSSCSSPIPPPSSPSSPSKKRRARSFSSASDLRYSDRKLWVYLPRLSESYGAKGGGASERVQGVFEDANACAHDHRVKLQGCFFCCNLATRAWKDPNRAHMPKDRRLVPCCRKCARVLRTTGKCKKTPCGSNPCEGGRVSQMFGSSYQYYHWQKTQSRNAKKFLACYMCTPTVFSSKANAGPD